MQGHRHGYHTALRMGAIGLGLGGTLTFTLLIAASSGFMGESPPSIMFDATVLVVAIAGSVFNAFVAGLTPAPERIAAMVASAVCAFTAGVGVAHGFHGIEPGIHLTLATASSAALAFCFVRVIMACLHISGPWATYPPWIAGASCLMTGAAGLVGQNWLPPDDIRLGVPLVRDMAVFLIPMGVLLATGILPSLKLEPKSFVQSVRLRLPRNREVTVYSRTLAITLAGSVLGLVAHLAWPIFSSSSTETPAGLIPALFGILWFGLEQTLQIAADQSHGQATAKLATPSAKRFLKRHFTDRSAWAATVGLKTTNFIIDHDPKAQLQNEIPATLMQIRGEEIKRCVADVLGNMFLHSHVVGHRIFGAVDPESSIRPCVDALKMFSCLYLDAGPLVERRIKGLTQLMPIIDPGLARMLNEDKISDLIRRNLWFFHFDYGWIDQHVIHTPRSTRYDVRVGTLPSKVRHSMLAYLEKTGGVGNFIWVGPQARDRILQEAPMLKNVIEACPVATDGGDERLMFMIKFEQLIPRLQRYYDFDTMRKSILDFEPSPESQRLITLLGLQATKAKTPEQIEDLLKSLTSVPWRGFKEKDSALHLVLTCYRNINETLGGEAALHSADDPRYRDLHAKLLEAVRSIGYPSQILHHAQINKLALRDVVQLLKAAQNAASPRFHEAWLLLASNDYSRQPEIEKEMILSFLEGLGERRSIAGLRLVQAKAIDAVSGVGATLPRSSEERLGETLGAMAKWLGRVGAEPDVCCHFLDACAFLGEHHGLVFDLDNEAVKSLDGHFQTMQNELGMGHPKLIAVMSRWQEYRGRPEAA